MISIWIRWYIFLWCPLYVDVIVTSSRNNVFGNTLTLLIDCIAECNSGNVFRVATQDVAILSVVDAGVSEDTHSSSIVTNGERCSSFIGPNTVDICSVHARLEAPICIPT